MQSKICDSHFQVTCLCPFVTTEFHGTSMSCMKCICMTCLLCNVSDPHFSHDFSMHVASFTTFNSNRSITSDWANWWSPGALAKVVFANVFCGWEGQTDPTCENASNIWRNVGAHVVSKDRHEHRSDAQTVSLLQSFKQDRRLNTFFSKLFFQSSKL